MEEEGGEAVEGEVGEGGTYIVGCTGDCKVKKHGGPSTYFMGVQGHAPPGIFECTKCMI